jgi:hypothetical protein
MTQRPVIIDFFKELGEHFNPNQMPEKKFKRFKTEIFMHMQKTRIESEGSHTFEVEVDNDIIEVTFDASIDTEISCDGFTDERTGTDTVNIMYVEVKCFDILISTAQVMELENEVKLNA